LKPILLSLLSRKTSSNFFIPEIDGFRFFAIGTVLLYHLNTHVSRIYDKTISESFFQDSWIFRVLSQGSVGVDVFFGISGFILAIPFARHHLFGERPVDLRAYYWRRVTRLEPPYLVSLILFLLVHVFFLHESVEALFPNFLASAFYVHNIVYDKWSVINPIAWSLEVEVQFYILAPVLGLFFAIKNPIHRRMVLVAVILFSILHYNWNYDWIQTMHLRKSLLMHLHQFLIGFLFADLFLTDLRNTLSERSYWFDVIGLCSLAMLLAFNDPFFITNDLIFSICLLLSFVSIFKGKLLNRFFVNPAIVVIGGMCYTIYLLHYALIAFLAKGTSIIFLPNAGYAPNLLVQMLLILPVVLLVSAVFFVTIERPCMDKDWPSKLKAKLTAFFAPQPR
jgi:peptidoglycan/LPS O-acetylase OafA/YrhL